MKSINRSTALALILFAGLANAQTTAITGATVHTVGPQGTIENATVVFADGRIVAVGSDVRPPDGADVIDASGKVITPGLFTPAGYLGLVEVGFSAGPLDFVQRGDEFTASFDVADAFNPRSTLIAVNRIEGVTRALVSPEASFPDESGLTSHVIAGLGSVVNLGGGSDSIDRRGAVMVANLGETGALLAGGNRVTPLMILKSALDEAVDYREHGDAYERGQHSDYSFTVQDLEAMQRVLSATTPMFLFVDRASDIESVIAMTREHGIRTIIAGGVEAWLLADELAAANIAVVLAPEANLPSDFDRINATNANVVRLVDAGVKVAFADSRDQTHNARNITQSAGNAIVAGITFDEALRAITLSPAEMYGVADRLGSIEAGKEADIVIWPGDPFELTNYPEQVIIRGQAIDMVSRQTLLRDRYLDTETATPPAY
ncbi:MAG: amidohydrolase family protein, partial [Woeseiaceae bacterium]